MGPAFFGKSYILNYQPMKVTRVSFFALSAIIAFSILVAGCSKSNSNSNTSSTSISATIGSSSFSASAYSAGVYSTDSAYFGVLGLQIANKDSSIFSLTFSGPVVLNQQITTATNVNSYLNVGYQPNGANGNYYGASYYDFGQGSAIVTVTSYDSTNHKIAGTFSGVLYNENSSTDSVIVTNGKFSTTYTVIP